MNSPRRRDRSTRPTRSTSSVSEVRLHHRIVVALALVALVAIVATSYVAARAAARALESRVEDQVTHAAARISQSDFALNPAILQSVRALTGAEVITFTPGGRVLARTTDPQH